MPLGVGKKRLVDDDVRSVAQNEVVGIRRDMAIKRVRARASVESSDVPAVGAQRVSPDVTIEHIVAGVSPELVDVQATLECVVSQAAVDLVDTPPALDRIVSAQRKYDVLVFAAHQGICGIRAVQLERNGGKRSAGSHQHAVLGTAERDEPVRSGIADARLAREIRPELDHVEPGRIVDYVLPVTGNEKIAVVPGFAEERVVAQPAR